MGPDLSRRSLLKAGGLTAAAAIIGWRPSLGAAMGPAPEGPLPPGSYVTLGAIMQVSDEALLLAPEMRDWIEDKMRAQMARFAERERLVHPLDERWAEYRPGNALLDPLWGSHIAIRLKQEWRVA
jgi:hypothetical protein